jgi:hypothetical protein
LFRRKKRHPASKGIDLRDPHCHQGFPVTIRAADLPCALLLCALTFPTSSYSAAPSLDRLTRLDEIVVTGEALSVTGLRAAMIEAEQRFYDRYNELNDVEEFDVNCRVEAPTGSRVNRRSCTAVFEDNAAREAGVESFKIRQFVHEYGGRPPYIPATPPVPGYVTIDAKRPDFQRNMREVVFASPDLAMLLRERVESEERYASAQRGEQRSAPQPITASTATDCAFAEPCSVTGVLRIFASDEAFIGILAFDDGSCINISLPEARSRDLEGRAPDEASFSGITLPFPGRDPHPAFLLAGRAVARGNCGRFLFVN